ncbi:MAG: tetratricopeptide repeat protein [Bacteroidota bacterium]
MKKCLLVLLVILVSGLTFAQTNSRGGESENSTEQKLGVTHAILIGISDYRNLPKSHQLNFADDDALLFQEYLKSQGNVKLKTFLNINATGKDIIGREIQNTLLNEAKPGDHVLIYFAGHGDIDTLIAPAEGFLLLNNVDPPVISSYEFSDALALNSLRKLINSAADKRQIDVTLIADACHSGAVKNGIANNAIININDRVSTITSCKASEVSEESINWGGGHGVFTYYLIQGLIGLADIDETFGNSDNVVDLSELEMYVKTKVSKERNKLQSPIFDNNNQLSFAVNPKLLKIVQQDKVVNAKSFETFSSTKDIGGNNSSYSEPCKSELQLFYQQTVNGKFFQEDLDSIDKMPFSLELATTKRLHSKMINCLSVSSDGFLTATSSLQGVAITTGMDLERVKWLKEIKGEVKAMSFSPNKYNLLVANSESAVEIWDVVRGTKVKELLKVPSVVVAVKYVDNNLVVLATQKGSIILWDVVNNSSKEYKMHKGSIVGLEILNDLVFTSGEDNSVLSFDLKTLKKGSAFNQKQASKITFLRALKTKNVLLGGTIDGRILMWDLTTNMLQGEIAANVGGITGMSADPTEQFCFFSGLEQKKTGLLNLNNFKVEKSKLYTTGSATGVVFDPAYHTVKTIEYDGSYTVQRVKILPENASATALYQTVLQCDEFQDIKYKIDGTLIVGLNQKVNQVLDQLVNGKELPSAEDLQLAIRNAKMAYEIGKDDEFAAEQLKINLNLLSVYDIILNKKTSDFLKAKELLKEVELLDPNGAYVFNVAANLYLLLKETSLAKEMALKAEKLSPNWTETQINTGKILQQTGDLKGAETRFKSAITKAPEQAKGYVSLGNLYSEQGKHAEALKQYEKAFERNPSTEEIRLKYKESYNKTPPSSKPVNQFEKYLSAGQNLISNQSLFKGFNNELNFIDIEVPKKCKLICENGTINYSKGKYFIVPSGGAKSATIKMVNFLSDEIVSTQSFVVKDIPKLEFLWGKSSDGGFVSMNTFEFYLGYLSEPELANCGVVLKGYEAIFIDENTQGFGDFNPNRTGGAIAFQGQGKTIHPGIFSEINYRMANEIVGKVCVQYVIEYPSGESEVKSACFSY